ncbi:MAG: hypothetical protein NWE95_01810 [Candidatus Bathyarchaeota archaeon]|nr:hypothetical protein [Candidatus Bathyarchaeota archaeon]
MKGDRLRRKATAAVLRMAPEERDHIEVFGVLPATNERPNPIAYHKTFERIENPLGDLIVRETVQVQTKIKIGEAKKHA